ncbi:MAG: AAA family ATPase [Gemmatimonadaceae bacterium]|nr:AAA family ATPase [Gemmatimonadaceae bacterium]
MTLLRSASVRLPSQLDVLRGRRAAAPLIGEGDGDRSMHTLVIASGKGGVGTSVMAALTALAAFDRGERVLLVDADDQVGPLALLLGCIAPDARLDDLLRGLRPAHDVLAWLDPRFALLPGGVPLDRMLPALAGAERRVAFRRVATVGQQFDRVIIDAGSRLDGVLAACAADASAVLVVTAPDAVANAAAFATLKAVARAHAPVTLAAMANRATDEDGTALLSQLADGCARFLDRSLSPLGAIAADEGLDRALRAGMPLVDAARGSPAAQAVAAATTTWCTTAPAPAARADRRAS